MNIKDVEDCHKATGSKSSGKLILEWDILKNGNVGEVKIIKSVKKSLDECVIQKIKTWTFPKPPNRSTARVKYPFVFSSLNTPSKT